MAKPSRKRVVSVSVKRGKALSTSYGGALLDSKQPKIPHILLARLAAAVETLSQHYITVDNISDESWEGRFTEPEDDPLLAEPAAAIGFIAGVAAAFNLEPLALLAKVPS